MTLPVAHEHCGHIYNQFVVRAPNRDGVKQFLESRGIGTAVYFPRPFHQQECFAYLGYETGQFPQAERAAAETLALPIYGELTDDQLRYVVDMVGKALEQ